MLTLKSAQIQHVFATQISTLNLAAEAFSILFKANGNEIAPRETTFGTILGFDGKIGHRTTGLFVEYQSINQDLLASGMRLSQGLEFRLSNPADNYS